ncbi:hypothetical protein [Weissella soli]|uniref:hypothetical protein n=1 Tax=Weissella soli TaxID=155866 RepID=UPI00359F4895
MTDDYLITLFSAEEARRNRVIFHLLTNQSTVSSLYFGLRYGLLPIMGLEPKLTKPQFDQRLNRLLHAGLIADTSTTGIFILTRAGQTAQKEFMQAHYFPQHLDLWSQYDVVNFRDGFLLANQVVSEFSYDNTRYYPLQINYGTMMQVKKWYRQVYADDLAVRWKNDLLSYLATLDEQTANRLTARWVGHTVPGTLLDQIDFPVGWTDQDRQFWELDRYAEWSAQLADAAQQPLRLLWEILTPKTRLSRQAQLSYHELIAGIPPAQSAAQRHIKMSTIREHWLMAAILLPIEQFPYRQFFTDEVMTYFNQRLTGPIAKWQFHTVRQSDNPMEFTLFRLYEIYRSKEEGK